MTYLIPFQTDRQVKQLCTDEKKTVIQKFMHLLKDGEKIQKWSIFENFQMYILSLQNLMLVLQELQKNYSQIVEFLPIIGEGLSRYLSAEPKYLQKQSITLIFDITYRTLTQNPVQVEDWSLVLQKISKWPYSQYYVEKSFDFVNGSFSMNSSSQRRRVAFCIIKNLMDYSKNLKKLAVTKVLFFNKDQNFKTRILICQIMGKLIESGEGDQQIWKGIWEYFHDKQSNVREAAHKIISTIYHPPNFQHFIQSISQQNLQSEICKYLPIFLQTFKKQVQQNHRSKNEIISFINRIFKAKKTENTVLLLNGLCQVSALSVLTQQMLYQQVNFSSLPLRVGCKQIMQTLMKFYQVVEDIQFKESLKSLIFRAIKDIQYQFYGNCETLAKMFDFSQDQDISLYLTFCAKMLDSSKWYQLIALIQIFKNIVFTQNMYEKACAFMLKLWMSCPAFIIDLVINQIIYLVLINRRSFEFLITIRQKMLNSKFWSHRKNYIKFYSAIRSQTSFQCHKFMPILMYKNVVADKSYGVRLTFLQNATNIYKFTDPESTTQKGMIKEAVSKLEEDKDIYVRLKAGIVQSQITGVDRNVNQLADLYDRNRSLMQKQATLIQVVNEPRKVIKTENQISKSTAKSKRKFGNQQRRTVNIGKIQMHKDMSIDSIALNPQKQIINTANLIPKKNNLFRCHSVKIKAPPKKT